MPQPPPTDRLTAGEKRLAHVIDSSKKNAAARPRPQIDLVWDADPDRQAHGAG